ncbi:MAG: AsnC family transcriptional regulator [Nanoarchaeota archaeon]
MTLGRVNEDVTDLFKSDEKDRKILTLLLDDSRQPLSEIAKKVQLAKNSVKYRIERMQEQNVLLAFIPVMDISRFGYSYFHLFIDIDERQPDRRDAFFSHLKQHPHVRSVIEYHDRWDLEIVMIAKDIQQFNTLVMEMLEEFHDVILERDMVVDVFEYHACALPMLKPEKLLQPIQKDRFQETRLDDLDMKLLHMLSQNVRLPAARIAEQVPLSADAVNYRIKGYIRSGIIQSCTILANVSKLGYKWFTVAVKFKTMNKDLERRLTEYVRTTSTIVHAEKTIGSWDVILYVLAKETRDFHTTFKGIKTNFSDSVGAYDAWVGYKEHYFRLLPSVVSASDFIK